MDNQIISNLSPLVGTKQDNIKRCPSTAYQVCKELRIASLICLDVDADTFLKNGIRYTFDNKVSIRTYNIHNLAIKKSVAILDTSYVLTAQKISQAPYNIRSDTSLNDALFLYSLQKKVTDSAIYDALISNKKLTGGKWFKHVLFIILDAFSLRYSLYDYYIQNGEFVYGELGQDRLNRLINNVYYVKAKLEDYDYKETVNVNHHLNTLYYNLLMLRQKMKEEFIEVNRR